MSARRLVVLAVLAAWWCVGAYIQVDIWANWLLLYREHMSFNTTMIFSVCQLFFCFAGSVLLWVILQVVSGADQ